MPTRRAYTLRGTADLHGERAVIKTLFFIDTWVCKLNKQFCHWLS